MKTLKILLAAAIVLSGCTTKQTTVKGVVATTSWTAAYALAAGATDISVLAPYEMVHPSEYELRPGDIVRLNNASLIVYAGYEVMVNQIKTGLDIPVEKLMKIETSYYADEIETQVMLIAGKLGTEETARKNIKEIRELLAEGKHLVHQKGFDKQPALVHFFQESFAGEMGIPVSMIFGPAPPEPKQILDMTKTGAILILDNAHNPVGGMMQETMQEIEYRLLLNFPGTEDTRTLADVIRYNIDEILGD